MCTSQFIQVLLTKLCVVLLLPLSPSRLRSLIPPFSSRFSSSSSSFLPSLCCSPLFLFDYFPPLSSIGSPTNHPCLIHYATSPPCRQLLFLQNLAQPTDFQYSILCIARKKICFVDVKDSFFSTAHLWYISQSMQEVKDFNSA